MNPSPASIAPMPQPVSASDAMLAAPAQVVAFWQDAGPKRWFKKNARFDALFRQQFACEYQAAAAQRLNSWQHSAPGCLALLILLDQYPRNAFRETPRAFATDDLAHAVAKTALAAGFDQQTAAPLQAFFYLPFIHSERLADQELSLRLCQALGKDNREAAQTHRDIIARFGRFPHRNHVLGRTSTADELQFLATGGFAG